MTNDELFGVLQSFGLRPRMVNGQWQCLCPAHDDHTPSMRAVVAPHGKLLLHCWSGCSFSAIRHALRLDSPTVQVPVAVIRRAVEESKRADPSVLTEWAAMQRDNDDADVEDHEQRLGIPLGGLRRLGTVWAMSMTALCAPMMDAPGGNVIGVRVRGDDGKKYAISGSRNGLFIPRTFTGDGFLYVPEGFTDAAAMAGLGLDAVGRPSCNGGRDLVRSLVRRAGRPTVIVSDRDGPGVAGAELLASELVDDGARVRILKPPPGVKDVREWVRHGATRESIEWAARHRSEM